MHHLHPRRQELREFVVVAAEPIVGSIDNRPRNFDSRRKLHKGPDHCSIENIEQRSRHCC